MAYRFAGFFVRGGAISPGDLMNRHVLREIDEPFDGQCILVPEYIGAAPDRAAITGLSTAYGFDTRDWLFVVYDCWAGQIDYVYALGVHDNSVFGPICEADHSRASDAYIQAMGSFGVSRDQALQFKPFERGFWGAP